MIHQFKIRMAALVGSISMMAVPLAAQPNSPVAYQDTHVRFTVISDGALRLEWHPQGVFTDEPSFVAARRGRAGDVYPLATVRMLCTHHAHAYQ